MSVYCPQWCMTVAYRQPRCRTAEKMWRKVTGAENLDQLTRDAADYFVLFSQRLRRLAIRSKTLMSQPTASSKGTRAAKGHSLPALAVAWED